MATLPTMPLHTDALLSDAGDLPNALFGAYCRLLFRWWREGAAPEKNEKRLARWAGLSSADFEDLKEFLTETPDGWIQKKLHATFRLQSEKSAKARASANARWNDANASENECQRNAGAMLSMNHEPVIVSSNEDTNSARRRAKDFSGKGRGRKRQGADVPRGTQIKARLPEGDARALAEKLIERIGEPAYASFFQNPSGPTIAKNCEGYVIRVGPGVRRDLIQQRFAPVLTEVFGKGGWRFESA